MNMTIVIVSKRSMELLLALALCCGITLLFVQGNGNGSVDALDMRSGNKNASKEGLYERVRMMVDENHELDDETIGALVKYLGEDLEGTMGSEMKRLVSEVKYRQMKGRLRKSGQDEGLSEEELNRLVEDNKAVGADIHSRIQLAGDNKGALPQWSLRGKASSLLAIAHDRLSSASSYIGSRMQGLGRAIKSKVPTKLRRFFKWPTFLRFKMRHHKTYKSLREELYRQMVFLRTHVEVGMQHLRFLLRRDTYLLGPTQYADMTAKEYTEATSNREAEAESRELKAAGGPDEQTLQTMHKLLKEGKNYYGKPNPAGARGGSKRAKREVDELDQEDESDEDFDIDSSGMDDEDEDEDDSNDQDAFRLIEEFANGVDLAALDDIDNETDEALNKNRHLPPVDLRETGCILRPENQNNCGVCYAHVVTAATSYHQCMANNNKQVRFHARFGSDCGKYLSEEGKPKFVNGCRGGRMSLVFSFYKNLGVPLFATYEQARIDASVHKTDDCAFPRPASLSDHNWNIELIHINSFDGMRLEVIQFEQVALHLRTFGPVLVNVRLWPDFRLYEGGLYDKMEDEDICWGIHSMMIVGHERDSLGRDVYTIWNSHGIVWGEYGYARLSARTLKHYGVMFSGISPYAPEDTTR